MLKKIILSAITFSCMLLLGCQADRADSERSTKYIPTSNEVIGSHGMMENVDRLNLFVERVQQAKKDKVRLVHYTIEGDPIFRDLNFDGKKMMLKIDSREDQYGGGTVETYECKGIHKRETETETSFILEGCPEEQMVDLLTISYDVNKEDSFDFELKYGVGKKNIINTKDQELIKDLQNGEIATVKDFQLSKSEMNQIYKLMIFSNFLEEKKLSKKCNQKPYESYELTVWINEAKQHFEWTECDNGHDGKEMTRLANDILAVLKSNPTYQTLPKVKGEYE